MHNRFNTASYSEEMMKTRQLLCLVGLAVGPAIAFQAPGNLPRVRGALRTRQPHQRSHQRHRTIQHALPPIDFSLPFGEIGQSLFDSMDIGGAFPSSGDVPEAATAMVLDSVGRDLLVFLMASVIVTPLATYLGITPILGYLLAGALLGPHALDVFSNTKADVELGDFGILFLLFSEGLEVSTSRLQKLANYLPLGMAQISLTSGVLAGALLLGAPQFLDRFLPLDTGLIDVHNPSEALILALAGTLSTSAFIFPVLKDLEWEEDESGQAATSILLLQDLAVAPMLVLLPYIVGKGPTDYGAIGFLTAKATLGFGSVIYVGSFVLRRIFQLVAQAQSTETFVALCLLVSVGIGEVAKLLGLTDTAGAFAAGVLLANTNYRAQIQADILPFKGILLGIFFMDAGSSFDIELVLTELPTVLTGVVSLMSLKAITLFAATKVPRWMEPNRLPEIDATRLALLLAGGGEFAFVVLALAERLKVLPDELGGVLTAIVLITMSTTPILGELAMGITNSMENPESPTLLPQESDLQKETLTTGTQLAPDAVVVCGYGEIGQSVLRVLGADYVFRSDTVHNDDIMLPKVVAFDNDPSLLAKDVISNEPHNGVLALFGDGSNPAVIRSSGVATPVAIYVAYEDHYKSLSATARLRGSFATTPIFGRAQSRSQARSLKAAGATEVVVEGDELSQTAVSLLRRSGCMATSSTKEDDLRLGMAEAAGVSVEEVDEILDLFKCIDREGVGMIDASQIVESLRKSNSGVVSDDEFESMESWTVNAVQSSIPPIEFCRLYFQAPDDIRPMIQLALSDDACLI